VLNVKQPKAAREASSQTARTIPPWRAGAEGAATAFTRDGARRGALGRHR